MKRHFIAVECVAIIILILGAPSAPGCRLWEVGPAPSYHALRERVKGLNHAIYPVEVRLDSLMGGSGKRPPGTKRLVNDLLQLDEQVQHVNAELVLEEVPEAKIEDQIDRICLRLRELQAELDP